MPEVILICPFHHLHHLILPRRTRIHRNTRTTHVPVDQARLGLRSNGDDQPQLHLPGSISLLTEPMKVKTGVFSRPFVTTLKTAAVSHLRCCTRSKTVSHNESPDNIRSFRRYQHPQFRRTRVRHHPHPNGVLIEKVECARFICTSFQTHPQQQQPAPPHSRRSFAGTTSARSWCFVSDHALPKKAACRKTYHASTAQTTSGKNTSVEAAAI